MSGTGNRSHPNRARTHGLEGEESHGNPATGRGSGSTHQESRDHNKHNNPGQSGHKPQHHGPAEEKP